MKTMDAIIYLLNNLIKTKLNWITVNSHDSGSFRFEINQFQKIW